MSASNENDGSVAPQTEEEEKVENDGNNNNKPVFTSWCGYDVVLTENFHPSETATSHNNTNNTDGGKAPRLTNSGILRRQNSSSLEHYGWLRQLSLRSDVPSIDEIKSWSFDVLQFEDTVLIQVFIKILEYYNLLDTFQLDREILEKYCYAVMNMHHKDCYYQLVDIESSEGVDMGAEVLEESDRGEGISSSKKPEILCEYHNWYHAMSVVHTSFLFVALGVADAFLNPLDLFCVLFGALIHDLDHPGTNSDFEVKRSSSLAQLYGNDAVLERHSINMGLSMCRDNPDLDILKPFNDEDLEYIKHFIGESVLATDPARHGTIVKEGLAFVEKGLQDYRQGEEKEEEEEESGESKSTAAQTYFDKNNPQHRLYIGRLILHSSDISNPCANQFQTSADWAIRVVTEFTRQAEKEKRLQLPVTEFMDGLDSKYKIAKLQIGFFNFMVKPLFHTIGVLFPKLTMLEEWGENNSTEYQAVIDAHDNNENNAEVKSKIVKEQSVYKKVREESMGF